MPVIRISQELYDHLQGLTRMRSGSLNYKLEVKESMDEVIGRLAGFIPKDKTRKPMRANATKDNLLPRDIYLQWIDDYIGESLRTDREWHCEIGSFSKSDIQEHIRQMLLGDNPLRNKGRGRRTKDGSPMNDEYPNEFTSLASGQQRWKTRLASCLAQLITDGTLTHAKTGSKNWEGGTYTVAADIRK